MVVNNSKNTNIKLTISTIKNKNTNMKTNIYKTFSVILLFIATLLMTSCWNSNSNSNASYTSKSPVGSYRDYHIINDKNQYWQYDINSDGTATVICRTLGYVKNGKQSYENSITEHTYWEYLEGNPKDDIRIKDREHRDWNYIDFSEMLLYHTYNDYRAKHGGRKITKIN